jgi:hypothetical protein
MVREKAKGDRTEQSKNKSRNKYTWENQRQKRRIKKTPPGTSGATRELDPAL